MRIVAEYSGQSRALVPCAVAAAAAPSGAIHARASESGHSMTSAERSEAREIDARIQRTCRVASPLVMAMRGSCVECNDVRLTHRGFCRSTHYLLLRRGVVPHGSTSDARIDRSGFAALRLRQHPAHSTPERAKAGTQGRARSEAKRERLMRGFSGRAVWHHLW
jgi:hypothetical protein